MFQKFDYNGGRTFVVGDIHGCFELLEQKLDALKFDNDKDHVFSVGDLVDRGPRSDMARHYLRQKWFHAVRGNHEEMCINAGGTYWHVQNGGAWWNELDEREKARFIAAFKALPFIIQFESPSGRQIGVIHAGFRPRKWANIEEHIIRCEEYYREENPLIWDRTEVYGAKSAQYGDDAFTVEGIDHIYFGHTPTGEPLSKGNMSWIDTGAFATNKLTVIEVK